VKTMHSEEPRPSSVTECAVVLLRASLLPIGPEVVFGVEIVTKVNPTFTS
jgi:hypothetical protein